MEVKGALPLKGIKIADFGRYVNLPMATKYLGDYGATVVTVEEPRSTTGMPPFAGGIPDINRSGIRLQYASSKYSLTLNLKNPGALEIARRLIAWSDVVVENFAIGTMARWGLGYEDVKIIKPDIIMLSSSMLGQTGPHRAQIGFGEQLSGLSGFTNLTGWPGRPPAGTPNAYTDFVAPSYILVVILAALGYRRRTGRGLYIDLAQIETGVSFLSHLVLDYNANGVIPEPEGNHCRDASPHGVYRCSGSDRWCAIAAFSDEQWQSLCKVIGKPEYSQDPRFADLPGRKENEDELDRLLEEWTGKYPAERVMEMMQGAGIPAGVVKNNKDIVEDPQLNFRHHFVAVDQPEIGEYLHEDSAFRLSKTPSEVRPAPRLGENNEHVCTQFLNISDDEFLRLFNDGAFNP